MTQGHDIRIGLIGCGHRGIVGFLRAFKELGRAGHIVALCDTNPKRLDFAAAYLGEPGCRRFADVEQFLQCPGMSAVIIAVPDYLHKDIALRAFACDKDVVCEKPMATTLADCQAMIAARGGHRLRVAFNFRHHELAAKVKEIVASGAIGRVLQVELADVVSWQHGADYFRRWHRLREQSGGLLVHKSVHTFDAINWWMADRPQSVSAQGGKLFYVPARQKGERCATCGAKSECPFHIDLNQDVPGQVAGIDGFYRQMYLEAEPHDGYIRDTCVFHRTNTINDTYHVLIRYRSGALCSYSAVFYAPYEDRKGAIQGDLGRIEFSRLKGEIRVYTGSRPAGEAVHRLSSDRVGHVDADANLVRSLFEPAGSAISQATAEDGYWAVAVAAGANESIATGAGAITLPRLKGD